MTKEQKQRHDDAVLTILALYGSTMFAYGRAATTHGSLKDMMHDLAYDAARGTLSALMMNGPTDEDVASIVDEVEARR